MFYNAFNELDEARWQLKDSLRGFADRLAAPHGAAAQRVIDHGALRFSSELRGERQADQGSAVAHFRATGEPILLEPTESLVGRRLGWAAETTTTDGPFAETKEQLGGYYLLDCENLDQAIEYAAKIPSAAHGTIEIRPVMLFE